jgi:hypothetical protein
MQIGDEATDVRLNLLVAPEVEFKASSATAPVDREWTPSLCLV